jgi:hypothetical protein
MRCVPVVQWPRTSPFHGGNTGSNPVGDANKANHSQLVLVSLLSGDWAVIGRIFSNSGLPRDSSRERTGTASLGNHYGPGEPHAD